MDDKERNLKNVRAVRQMERTQLEYVQTILEELHEDPSMVDDLVDELGMEKDEFYERLSFGIPSNITFYDQSLSSVIELKNGSSKTKK